MQARKIGFYGGAFNPPTIAHIKMAKKALNELNLDKIIFMPVGDLYQKSNLESRNT
jgi:nicotinate-nucleotide adenylyltransferase